MLAIDGEQGSAWSTVAGARRELPSLRRDDLGRMADSARFGQGVRHDP